MKVGSLFSGIGGIEIGFEKAGFETEWFVEYEPYAQTILKKRFPKAHIYGDVTKLDFRTVPKVEVLTGGFPCQDISNAGKRNGIEGSRSSLWKYYLKAISQIQPRIAFIENVSALIGRGLDVVLCDLAKIGYDAEWHCVSASSVGANHQRDRIFIIAYPNSNGNRPNNTSDIREKEERWNKDNQGIISEQCSEIDGKQDVSNTMCRGTNWKQCEKGVCKEGKDVENSFGNRMYEGNRKENNRREESSEYTDKSFSRGWWATEPKLGRVADGIPNRMDRIKCLGNAVVPQVAEVFARAIKELT